MTVADLELKWKSIRHTGNAPYRSIRVSSACIPEIYLALDLKGRRHMILKVPEEVNVKCQSIEMQNLSLEWHEETRFILIGLRSEYFADLYNDLVLSLYVRIKDIRDPERYTNDFISSFHKWALFFEDDSSVKLSEAQVKGLLGELVVLRYYLQNLSNASPNDILEAWQGPYERPHDFIFSSKNIEVKTKDTDQVSVRISSEFQLQPETGKELQLVIVDVLRKDDGTNLDETIREIKGIIVQKGADMELFLKVLAKAGLNGNNASMYNSLRWEPVCITSYNANTDADFPKVAASGLPEAISRVKYNLTVSSLEDFIIKKTAL